MKIFLLEYITAGGFNKRTLPNALLQEGLFMRDALIRDFSMLDDVEIITTYDARLAKPSVAKTQCITKNAEPFALWLALLNECDAALCVAPETDHILTQLTQLLVHSGVRNLGCHSSAVAIASNKFDTFKTLKNAGILTIPTFMADMFDERLIEPAHSGFVVKPIDGAGCENTWYFQNPADLKYWLKANARLQNKKENLIVQPFISGQPASISALFKNGKAWVLSCNAQNISMHTLPTKQVKLAYTASIVSGLNELSECFGVLANELATTLPGLNGYVGIDVIIQNHTIYVVEINPRITTSYIGLQASLGVNPASLILNLAKTENFSLPHNMTHFPVQIDLHA